MFFPGTFGFGFSPAGGSGIFPGATESNIYRGLTGQVNNDPKEKPSSSNSSDTSTSIKHDIKAKSKEVAKMPPKLKSTSKVAEFQASFEKDAWGEKALNEAFFKARQSDTLAQDPYMRHIFSTGSQMPLTGRLGYSQLLPLISALITLKYPKLGAGMMAASTIGKSVYDMTHPLKQMADITYAKGMKDPNIMAQALDRPSHNVAQNQFINQPLWRKILNLG